MSVIGVLSASAVFAILFAYLCTSFLLAQFNVQRRMLVGEKSLLIIVASNVVSLVLLGIIGYMLLTATGRYGQVPTEVVAMIAVGAQAIWLIRHLWLYRRDHLRVHYESYEN